MVVAVGPRPEQKGPYAAGDSLRPLMRSLRAPVTPWRTRDLYSLIYGRLEARFVSSSFVHNTKNFSGSRKWKRASVNSAMAGRRPVIQCVRPSCPPQP
jgi:hypothetical protein